MEITRHDRRRRLTLVLLVITSLALMSLDERGSGIINSIRSAAQDVVAPVQNLADDVFNPMSEWLDGLGRADELQAENERLQRQLDAARSQVAKADGSIARLKTLEQIVDLPDVSDGDSVTAEVVGTGAGNFSRTLRISKGSSAGIKVGQPVVVGAANSSALVGQVIRVSSNNAVVRRIDDPNFGAGAQLVPIEGGAGPTGIVKGQQNSNFLRFSVIDQTGTSVALKKGQIAVTLGSEGEPYPHGLVIGRIVHQVDAGGAIARDADVRPIVDLDALTIVKVLHYPPEPTP
jgi:rod shape-determining protein MreC